ncbi:MAG: hypothetical protein ACFCUJ_10035 [Thiotrichales bacterium]
MNGLLHRLARQALGARQGAIHSSAKLPFAPALFAPSDEPPKAPIAERMPAGPASTTLALDPPSVNASASAATLAQASTSGAEHRDPPRPLLRTLEKGNARHPDTARPDATFDPNTGPPPIPAMNPIEHAPLSATPTHSHADGIAPSLTPSRSTATATIPRPGDERAPPPDRDTVHPTPRRLLAESEPTPNPPPRQPGPVPNAPGTPAEPAEVHVHIGRIEVIANYPAPAPNKPARPVRQPMSLDDYLAQRREGSA